MNYQEPVDVVGLKMVLPPKLQMCAKCFISIRPPASYINSTLTGKAGKAIRLGVIYTQGKDGV